MVCFFLSFLSVLAFCCIVLLFYFIFFKGFHLETSVPLETVLDYFRDIGSLRGLSLVVTRSSRNDWEFCKISKGVIGGFWVSSYIWGLRCWQMPDALCCVMFPIEQMVTRLLLSVWGTKPSLNSTFCFVLVFVSFAALKVSLAFLSVYHMLSICHTYIFPWEDIVELIGALFMKVHFCLPLLLL